MVVAHVMHVCNAFKQLLKQALKLGNVPSWFGINEAHQIVWHILEDQVDHVLPPGSTLFVTTITLRDDENVLQIDDVHMA